MHSHGVVPANQNHGATVHVEVSGETVQHRLTLTLGHLEAIVALWPDAVALTDAQRSVSSGRAATRLGGPLVSLFKIASEAPYASAFALLGNSDAAGDSAAFDPAACIKIAERVDAVQTVRAEMKKIDALFGDDLLHHGAMIVGPGKRVIEFARTLARSNTRFRAKAADVLHTLRSMTTKARSAKAAAIATPPPATPPAPHT